MDNVDYIEKKLAGHYWAGDVESAKKLGKELSANVLRKKRTRKFAIRLACSLAAISAVAVSVSFIVMNFLPKEHQSFTYAEDETITYLTSLASNYYPYSVAYIQNDEYKYGTVYYSYNSKDDGYLAFRINQSVVSRLLIEDVNGSLLLSSDSQYSNYHVNETVVTFYPAVIDNEATKISFGKISIDLAKYCY